MDREQIEKWAREAGMWSDLYSHWTCSEKQIEHFARLVRDAALEEAKDAVLRVGIKYPRVGHQYICGSNDARSDCIDAIDALRSKP